MKPAKAQPSELEVLKAEVAHLSNKVDALMTMQNPVTYGSRVIARCHCNKLSTRTITIKHPTQGIHSQVLCDDCETHGFLHVLKPEATVFVTHEADEKVLAFSRRINGYLSFRP